MPQEIFVKGPGKHHCEPTSHIECLRLETPARDWRSLTSKISIHRRFAAQTGNSWQKKNVFSWTFSRVGQPPQAGSHFAILPNCKTEKVRISGPLPGPAIPTGLLRRKEHGWRGVNDLTEYREKTLRKRSFQWFIWVDYFHIKLHSRVRSGVIWGPSLPTVSSFQSTGRFGVKLHPNRKSPRF